MHAQRHQQRCTGPPYTVCATQQHQRPTDRRVPSTQTEQARHRACIIPGVFQALWLASHHRIPNKKLLLHFVLALCCRTACDHVLADPVNQLSISSIARGGGLGPRGGRGGGGRTSSVTIFVPRGLRIVEWMYWCAGGQRHRQTFAAASYAAAALLEAALALVCGFGPGGQLIATWSCPLKCSAAALPHPLALRTVGDNGTATVTRDALYGTAKSCSTHKAPLDHRRRGSKRRAPQHRRTSARAPLGTSPVLNGGCNSFFKSPGPQMQLEHHFWIVWFHLKLQHSLNLSDGHSCPPEFDPCSAFLWNPRLHLRVCTVIRFGRPCVPLCP